MSPRVRKLVLTAHVVASVGWVGAVVSFLVLALVGLRADSEYARATYVAMDLTGWYVIVPFALAAVATGLVQALGTPWGLFRHYWVVIKLVISVLATIILLLHMRPVSHLGALAAAGPVTPTDLRGVRIQLAFDAAAAIVALVVATVLSIYKPQGQTPYGWRKEQRFKDAGS